MKHACWCLLLVVAPQDHGSQRFRRTARRRRRGDCGPRCRGRRCGAIRRRVRDREQQAIIAELRKRYVDGPVLVVPRPGSGSINTMGATVIPGAGTVYRALATKGGWGSFDAKDGAMISADGDTVSLPAPVIVDATTLKGEGRTATVGPGWKVQPGPRPGSFRVVPQ